MINMQKIIPVLKSAGLFILGAASGVAATNILPRQRRGLKARSKARVRKRHKPSKKAA